MSCVKHSKPSFRGFSSSVQYVDPLNIHPNEVDIFFVKHFKYTYQNEYRAIRLSEKPVKNLNPFFIEIGNMHRYAEIIRI
jgi:hypothetical protein